MSDSEELEYGKLAEDAAVLRTYRQVFAVLALEAEKMVTSPESIDIDEAIFEAFAASDSEGLTEAQIVARCPSYDADKVGRRVEVLRKYGAIGKVFERRMERYLRATFPPYVMLLFLRRLAEQGGMAELHRMLGAARQQIESPDATAESTRAEVRGVTNILRLLANSLSGLATSADVAQLRENAQLLWGNEELIAQARGMCEIAPHRFPELLTTVKRLRTALAAYIDATEAAAARMLDRAATTQGLGFLPLEVWDSFVKHSSAAELAAPLAGFVFDAPAVWLDPSDLVEAVESAEDEIDARTPPPRTESSEPVDAGIEAEDGDIGALTAVVEEILGERDRVGIPELLRSLGDWPTARRVLSDLTAAHHHPDLPYAIEWSDTLAIDADRVPVWATDGVFKRTQTELVA